MKAAVNANETTHRRIAWLAVLLLLLLRIPYSVILTYLSSDSTGLGPAVFQFSTYVLTAFLIWWEREDLSAFHIDPPALALIVLFKPVQTVLLMYWGINTPLTFPHPVSILIWMVAISLTLLLWMGGNTRHHFRVISWAWLALGLTVGLLFSAVLNLGAFRDAVAAARIPLSAHFGINVSTRVAGDAFLYQIGFAAVAEEPLFRGFLWGSLRRLGWHEVWVWIVQAVLFMSGHIYFLNAMRFNFWVVVPTAGLLFGLLAWRSRSVAPGMLAHAAYNAGIYVILLPLLGSG